MVPAQSGKLVLGQFGGLVINGEDGRNDVLVLLVGVAVQGLVDGCTGQVGVYGKFLKHLKIKMLICFSLCAFRML